LAEEAEAERGVAADFAGVGRFVAEDDAEKRRFSRTVAANEAVFVVVGERTRQVVKDDFVAVMQFQYDANQTV
jgi:hypothetical protein